MEQVVDYVEFCAMLEQQLTKSNAFLFGHDGHSPADTRRNQMMKDAVAEWANNVGTDSVLEHER